MTEYEVKKKHLWYYKCNTQGCRCNKSAVEMHKKYDDLLLGYELPAPVQEILNESIKKILRERSVSIVDELGEYRRRLSVLKGQRDTVMMRYGLGEIPRTSHLR